MRAIDTFAAAVALIALVPPSLSPATLKAYEHYVSLTEQRITAERDGKAPLLWIDRQPERERARVIERLKRGETVVAEMETREAGKEIPVKDGIVHHWVATVLLPGVKIDRAMAFVGDYAKYPQAFAPLVTRASAFESNRGPRRGGHADVGEESHHRHHGWRLRD